MATASAPAPLPIAAVTGTVGKTTLAIMLDHLARAVGWRTVTWLDSGVSINGHAQAGELAPWSEGLTQLLQGKLELAIQELPAATIQAVGLPQGAYKVGIVTNLAMNDGLYTMTSRALRQRAANEALVSAVHPAGRLLLNADDHAVVDLAEQARSPVILWALRRQSPALTRHLERGGTGLYLNDETIVWEEATQRQHLGNLHTTAMPFIETASFQAQNLLAALAAARVFGLSVEQLQRSLQRETEIPTLVERVITLEGGVHCRVVVARADCLPAMRGLVRLMSRLALGDQRVVGTAVWPAGLNTQEANEVARILARLFSLLYLYGPGSEAGARLIRSARPSERLPTFCRAVADQSEAMRRLTSRIVSGDRALLLAETVHSMVTLLDSYRLAE